MRANARQWGGPLGLTLSIGGAALLLIGLASSSRRPSGPVPPFFLPPPYPDPSKLPSVTDGDLLNPPAQPGPDDLLWQRFAADGKRPGAVLSAEQLAESKPSSRLLTAFERWALRPYFPVSADLDHVLHNGIRPPFPENVEIPPELWAVTLPQDGKDPFAGEIEPEVWFPNEVRPLWQLWWLSVLAHELTHAAQIRIGMTAQQAAESFQKYGYVDSPIERQARWNQRRALDGMIRRARAFYHVA